MCFQKLVSKHRINRAVDSNSVKSSERFEAGWTLFFREGALVFHYSKAVDTPIGGECVRCSATGTAKKDKEDNVSKRELY